MSIPDWLAENYEQIIADPNRGMSYEDVAVVAESRGGADVAAWARKRAAESGRKVTPEKAEPVEGAVVKRGPGRPPKGD